jgi:heat shock protein HtpX
MWLQVRLYLLVALLFAILYGIIYGIGWYLGLSGFSFFIFVGLASVALVFIQFLVGPKIVEWTMRVKYVSEAEYPKLHAMVAQLATQAGLPNKPKVGVSQLNIPNAFAFGRTKRGARVCVTKGILDLLTDDELQAVLGHEISHVRHRDVAVITMLSVIPMVFYMIYISFFWGGMGNRNRNEGGTVFIGLIALAVYFITNLLVMYGSRIREYYADQGSTELGCQPRHLATALYKLTVWSARAPKQLIKQTDGMKAFFINDPGRALEEVRDVREIDVDKNGIIDQNELMLLAGKKINLRAGARFLEIFGTHPNVVKRIKHLATLQSVV